MQSFVDEVVVHAASGAGGAGSVSFRREKYVPKGGPDGGDGGKGGDVIVRVRNDLRTLLHLTRSATIHASRGKGGSGRNRHGADGADAYIDVPPGAAIYDNATDELLYDLPEIADDLTILTGGRGGKGNAHFKTSRNQAPRFSQPGEPGQERELRIELRLVADVGLVGKPNAGKSSLLGRLTAARPKIGDYPFTTKIPNLGVLYLDDRQLVVADIPGLIEGASTGAGLGFRFLKHVSRTRTIAYVIDAGDEDPCGTLAMLERELVEYGAGLEDRPRVIIANKLDLENAQEQANELRSCYPNDVVCEISVVNGTGIRGLAGSLFALQVQE